MSYNDFSKAISKSIASGAIAGGVSYFLLKRQDAIDILGFSPSEWVVDSVLVALTSYTSDLAGYYAIPWVESKMGISPSFQNITRKAVPTLLSGAQVAALKSVAVESPEPLKDLALSGGSKLLGDMLISFWM